MNERQREALRNVIDYDWDTEREDCEHQRGEGEDISDHVFAELVILQNFLDGTDYTPEHFLSEVDEEEESDGEV